MKDALEVEIEKLEKKKAQIIEKRQKFILEEQQKHREAEHKIEIEQVNLEHLSKDLRAVEVKLSEFNNVKKSKREL